MPLEICPEHWNHLANEGFSEVNIRHLVEGEFIGSIDADQAEQRGFRVRNQQGEVLSGSGLYFRFSDDFGQLRLDEPIIRPNGSAAKYLSPLGRKTQTLDTGGALVWTEGAKDAWAGTLIGGIPTGALCGVADWRKLPRDKRFTLLYDSDAITNPQVLLQLVKAGVKNRCRVAFVPHVEGQPKAGLCEWFKAGATPQHYKLLIENARKPEQLLWALPSEWEGLPREQLQPLAIAAASIAAYAISRTVIDGYLRPMGRLSGLTLNQLRKVYSQRLNQVKGKTSGGHEPVSLKLWEIRPFIREKYKLALNELTQQIELNGQPMEGHLVESFQFTLAEDHRVCLGGERSRLALVSVASESSYNPVADYLAAIERNVTPLPRTDWKNIASRYFKATGPLDNVKLQRWLIGAVARALNPGCEMQEALILSGGQGLFKSSFFKALGGEWFSDSLGALSNVKDDVLKLHRAWIHEWGEFDKVTSKKEANELKAFVSASTDHCRPPYRAAVESLPRRCVLAGTTNREDFLVDATGSRRYPVIRITEPIEIDLVLREREQIWAAAVAAFRRGDRWWYSGEETRRLNEEGKEFSPSDPWQILIADALDGRKETYIEALLIDVLKIEPGKQSTVEHRRVESCLRRLGWVAETNPDGSIRRRKISGTNKMRRFWGLAPSLTISADTLSTQPLPVQDFLDSGKGGEGKRVENGDSGVPEKSRRVMGRRDLIVIGSAVRIWCPSKKDLNHRFHGRGGTVTRVKDGGWFDVLLDEESRSREFAGAYLLLTGSPLDLNGGLKA
jgi:predicted P-loop ATPase